MSLLFGVAAWIGAVIALRPGPIEALAMWAPLVIVPLGLEFIPGTRWIRLAQPVAAVLAAASFALAPGTPAAALAAPWALVCVAMAILGATRFLRRRPFDLVETFIDAALGLVAVGGFGLLMSRAGVKLGGFEEPIVLLTAVHFHYTAFAAPLLIALAARRAGLRHAEAASAAQAGPRRSILIAGAAVVAATPLLAIGFNLHSPIVKIAAVALIAAGLAIFAWELVRMSQDEPDGRTRLLLGVAAFSIFWGMALAGLYSIGEFRQQLIVHIPAMAWSHGILNGFGFATCGLLAARKWR